MEVVHAPGEERFVRVRSVLLLAVLNDRRARFWKENGGAVRQR
jgi:hypothetical protein